VQTARSAVDRRRELERSFGSVDVDWEQLTSVATLADPNPCPKRAETSAPSRQDQPAGVHNKLSDESRPALKTRTFDLGDDVTMEFVLLPSGDLWVSTTEVTNKQYARFDAGHDSRLESRHGYQFGRLGYPLNKEQQPVVRVSWNEAAAFADWFSKNMGVRCALPTNEQWQYAATAGGSSCLSMTGIETDLSRLGNFGDRSLSQYAACTAHENYSSTRIIANPNEYDDWVPKDDRLDDGAFVSAEVGRYRANPWGLRDMYGNVWEWTRSVEPATEGQNVLSKHNRRIVRGGSWYDRPQRATRDDQVSYRPYHRVFNVGFRLVIEQQK
jgi:formylglycine-generating enzyme required for sulfatase activity